MTSHKSVNNAVCAARPSLKSFWFNPRCSRKKSRIQILGDICFQAHIFRKKKSKCRDLKKQLQVSNFVVNLPRLICVMCP